MFAKLLKHEWKATAGPLGLLTLGAAGIAVFGALVLRTLLHLINNDALTGAANLLLIPMGLLVVFSFLAIVLYALGVSLLLLVRFYKSRFTDQGYLTFTLPAKPSHILLSSGVNMLIWTVLAAVVTVTLFGMMLLVGLGLRDLQWTQLWQELALLFRQMDFDNVTYLILTGIYLLLSPVYSVVLGMSCLTIGSVVAKKHKIFAAIGIGYATSMVTGIINSTLSGTLALVTMPIDNLNLYSNLNMGVQIFVLAATTVAGYCLSLHLIKRKLNLP